MESIKNVLAKILKNPITDHVVFSHISADSHSIRFSNNSVNRENVLASTDELNVEVGFEKRVGSYRTNDLSEDGIKHAVNSAYQAAKLLPVDPEYMPPVTSVEAVKARLFKSEFLELNDDQKYGLLFDGFGRLKKSNLNSAGVLSTNRFRITVMNNRGVDLEHDDYTWKIKMTAMSENSSFRNSFVGQKYSDFDKTDFFDDVISKTRLSMNPKPIEPGKYDVVLSPAAVCELFMMFMFYNFDGKAIDEKRTAISDRIGKDIASDKVHVYSKPGYKLGPGLPFFSQDGMPNIEYDMIKNRKFATPWFTRYYAAKKGVAPTGRLPSNVIFGGGDKSTEELIRSLENGLYVNSFWYIRLVDLMDGIFTGMTRDGLYRVQNGKITGSVNNFRFNQNVIEMLMNTVEVGQEKRIADDWAGIDFVMPSILVKGFNFSSGTAF